jgi:hypothetical protein
VESLQDMELATKRQFFSLILTIIKNELRVYQIKVAFLKHSKNLQNTVDRLFDCFGSNNQLSEH